MKISALYLTTAAVLALGAASPAAADSLSESIGVDVINQMNQHTNGNWINRAINVEEIDASVTINALPTMHTKSSLEAAIDIGAAVEIGAEGSGTVLVPGIAGMTNLAANGYLKAHIDAENEFLLGNALVNSTAVIETVAAGAINTGHIASAAATNTTHNKFSNEGSLEDLAYLNGGVASASAYTANTGAEAFAAEGVYAELGSLSLSSSAEFYQATSGPATDVYAVNEAFNNANINGSVSITSNGTNLAGISTLAAGALNTGSISMGFDGAALNAAINSGGN